MTTTRTYVVLRPRHRTRRTARVHLALARRLAIARGQDPDQLDIVPARRGPYRYFVVRY